MAGLEWWITLDLRTRTTGREGWVDAGDRVAVPQLSSGRSSALSASFHNFFCQWFRPPLHRKRRCMVPLDVAVDVRRGQGSLMREIFYLKPPKHHICGIHYSVRRILSKPWQSLDKIMCLNAKICMKLLYILLYLCYWFASIDVIVKGQWKCILKG